MSLAKSRVLSLRTLRTLIINGITLGVAAGLVMNRRRNAEIPVRSWPEGQEAPFVEVIIPARNEERNIVPLVRSLLGQSYPAGRWRVTVVDDGSEDGTRSLVEGMREGNAGLRLVRASALPEGWTGKNHAMYTGAREAEAEAQWLLFVDADTRHARDMLSSVVLRAREIGADMLSLVIDVEMGSFWERVLVPQVGELYTLLVGTMDEVNADGGRAAANGQFILIRREVYEKAGGLAEVRGDVAEDRALAAACKALGARVRLEYGRNLVRARVYGSLGEMWAGYSKTMFWASGQRTWRALGVAAALGWYGVAPVVELVYGVVRGKGANRREALMHGALQLAPMMALRGAVCRQMGVPAVYAVTYPLGVLVGDAMLLFSVYRVRSGKGVRWKGRTYTR